MQQHVFLLHGLGRTKNIMAKMDDFLCQQGFYTHNLDYPSTQEPVEVLATLLWEAVRPLSIREDCCLHFVGHSLGAIIIRYLLQQHPLKNLGRIVLIGPPNQGSEVVDFFKRFSFYKRRYGPAGLQLGTKNNPLLEALPKSIDAEVGVIAGDRSVDKLFSWFLLSGPNDGKVTVKSTRLAKMKDHRVVHAAHPFLPNTQEVIRQTNAFLLEGHFQRS